MEREIQSILDLQKYSNFDLGNETLIKEALEKKDLSSIKGKKKRLKFFFFSIFTQKIFFFYKNIQGEIMLD